MDTINPRLQKFEIVASIVTAGAAGAGMYAYANGEYLAAASAAAAVVFALMMSNYTNT